jgi:hypothetical protein
MSLAIFIPMTEVRRQLEVNARQAVKIVAPEILTEAVFRSLQNRAGKKPEQPATGNRWTHSAPEHPNKLWESAVFGSAAVSEDPAGPFAIAFANEKAEQEGHYHEHHVEIYFSDHRMTAEYRAPGDTRKRKEVLQEGGAMIFGRGVVHRVQLSGLTLIVGVPSVKDDKKNEEP